MKQKTTAGVGTLCLVQTAASAGAGLYAVYRLRHVLGACDDAVLFSIAAVLFSALAVALLSRSALSAAAALTCGGSAAVGFSACAALGVSTAGMPRKAVFASLALLTTYLAFPLLRKLLGRRVFLWSAAAAGLAVYAATLLFGRRTAGAALGIKLFSGTFQLFELGKPLYVVVTAALLSMRGPLPSRKLRVLLLLTIAHCALLTAQSELGTMLCILAACAGQLAVWLRSPPETFCAALWRGKGKLYAALAAAGAAATVWFTLARYPYIAEKVNDRLAAWLDRGGDSYQLECALRAMGEGGLFGVAENTARTYIPCAANDMVFPSVVQLFGLLGGVCLALNGMAAACRSSDALCCCIATGSAAALGMQTMIAVCASAGLLPMTGITLPFVSDGGVSLAVCCAMTALVAAAGRRKENTR